LSFKKLTLKMTLYSLIVALCCNEDRF
jgi:hypothetical protein